MLPDRPAPDAEHACLQIGDWRLDPLAHEISRDGERRRLPKRLIVLLQTLAASPMQTLTREALLTAAWQRRVVGDEVLSRAIAELRQALDDDARAPRYIETLPKTGYRLLATVSRLTDAPGGQTPALSEHAAPARPATPASAMADAAPAQPSPPRSRQRRALLPALFAAALALLALLGWWRWPDPTPRWTAAALAGEQAYLNPPDWVRQPRFSRDGQWLVYLLESPETRHTRVALAPATGGEARLLELGPGRLNGPLLSPDGDQLAVQARQQGRCELRLFELPDGPWRAIAECSHDHASALEWRQREHLLFTAPAAAAGQGAGLWQIDPRSGERRQLTHPQAAQIADSLPRLAGDGRLAFLRGAAQAQQLWLLEDGHERLLIDSADRVPGLAWSADDQQLLIASNYGGFPALRAVDPHSGHSELLGGRGAATLDIASDGRLIYEQRRYDANLWLYRPGQPAQRLSDSTRYDAYPTLSPDASQLAYVSNRDGSSSVWLLPLAGGSERRLRLPEATAWVRPSWRRDGSELLLTRYDQHHHTELFAVPLDGTPLRPLAGADNAGFAGQEQADGSLLFARPDRIGQRLWQRANAAAPALPLAAAREVSEFRSGGDWVAWQQLGQTGVFLQSRHATGPARRLLGDLPAEQPLAWTLTADELFWVANNADNQLWLWRQRLPEGPAQAWMPLPGAPADAQIAVPADASFAVLSHVDRLQSELLQVPAPTSH